MLARSCFHLVGTLDNLTLLVVICLQSYGLKAVTITTATLEIISSTSPMQPFCLPATGNHLEDYRISNVGYVCTFIHLFIVHSVNPYKIDKPTEYTICHGTNIIRIK